MQWNPFCLSVCVLLSVFYPYKGSTSNSESGVFFIVRAQLNNTFLSAHAVLTEKAEAFQQWLNLPRCIAGEPLIHTHWARQLLGANQSYTTLIIKNIFDLFFYICSYIVILRVWISSTFTSTHTLNGFLYDSRSDASLLPTAAWNIEGQS